MDVFHQRITDLCLAYYAEHLGESCDPAALADAIMATEAFPMHYPTHHYLVPAVLLTVCRAAQNKPGVNLEADLMLALERAENVPGGSCGFQGCCGAAVGVGIFWSILTDCSPVSGKVWGLANGATGKALLELAEIGGPRCCKRCTWLAIRSALPKMEEMLHITLPMDTPRCRYHDQNRECLRKKCPFYQEEVR